MPYSKFTLSELKKKFGLQIERTDFVPSLSSIEISDWLNESLAISKHIPMLSEKSKSELIVMPVLLDMLKRNKYQHSLFSGVNFNVDESLGLVGECDFIISDKANAYDIEAPIVAMVEAKDDDIDLGIPQCIAQMLGAFQYNQNEGKIYETIFGCVTTGREWQFLKLQNNIVSIHTELIYISAVPQLLGIWQWIFDFYKKDL